MFQVYNLLATSILFADREKPQNSRLFSDDQSIVRKGIFFPFRLMEINKNKTGKCLFSPSLLDNLIH